MRSRFSGFSPVVLAAAALCSGPALLSSPALSGEAPPYDTVQAGKETFMKECKKCHSINDPLAETYSREDWTLTVNMMVSNGADLTDGQKDLVVAYLTAKSLFETRCNTCHSLERSLAVTKTREQWEETVGRMAGMKPGHINGEEAGEIAAFLAAGYPKKKK